MTSPEDTEARHAAQPPRLPRRLTIAEAVKRHVGAATGELAARIERETRRTIRVMDRAEQRAEYRAVRAALAPVPRRTSARPRAARRVRTSSRASAVASAGSGDAPPPPLAAALAFARAIIARGEVGPAAVLVATAERVTEHDRAELVARMRAHGDDALGRAVERVRGVPIVVLAPGGAWVDGEVRA